MYSGPGGGLYGEPAEGHLAEHCARLRSLFVKFRRLLVFLESLGIVREDHVCAFRRHQVLDPAIGIEHPGGIPERLRVQLAFGVIVGASAQAATTSWR
jgi:hypothetical protein